jgi:hypothetical protein
MRTTPATAATEPLFPFEIVVVAWHDPVIDTVGFPVTHPYVETLWLPVIGPSTTWALRRLGVWAAACPDGVSVPLQELAGSLGIGAGVAPSAPIQRTLRRLVQFGLARWNGRLSVRTTVPPLSARQLDRLSPALRRAHERMVAGRSATGEA